MEKCISDGIYCKMEGSASAAAPKGGVGATGVMNASGEGDVPRARIAICCTIKVQGVSIHGVFCARKTSCDKTTLLKIASRDLACARGRYPLILSLLTCEFADEAVRRVRKRTGLELTFSGRDVAN